MLTLLNESRADYEVVNVLDDLHNPGLRETIKTYSQWPTIPQVCHRRLAAVEPLCSDATVAVPAADFCFLL